MYDVTSGKKIFICDTIEDTDRGLDNSMSSDYIKTTEYMNRLAELEVLLEQLMGDWDEACNEYNIKCNLGEINNG